MRTSKIILGITGGIAAYKIPNLIRLLQKQAFDVQVILTKAGKKFISPLVLETLSGNEVLTSMWDKRILHVNTAKEADLFVLAPLSANTMGKLAYGLADNLLTSTILATRKPVLLVPSMNTGMWTNPLVQENLKKLGKLQKFYILPPETGELACGDNGEGRMPGEEMIIYEAKRLLTKSSLKGKKVLISMGATREHIDPVRFISNGSSGKMGYALAREAYFQGAEVTVIRAHCEEQLLPRNIEIVETGTVVEMEKAVKKKFRSCDIFISAAAVSDYSPIKLIGQKMKKKVGRGIELRLKENVDILKEVGKKKGKKIVVGFALESENLIASAEKKLKEKNPDYIVANSVESMGSDESEVTLIKKGGRGKKLGIMGKGDVAKKIFDSLMQ